jgi:hypothetical protein
MINVVAFSQGKHCMHELFFEGLAAGKAESSLSLSCSREPAHIDVP